MKRIGILSDTHGYWDDRYLEYFAECDEIWHAGDIGSYDLIRKLAEFRPVRAVSGNCDGGDTCKTYPEILEWECEGTKVMMTHIGGYPGKYAPGIRKILSEKRPQLFIAGHSHILKVLFDLTFLSRIFSAPAIARAITSARNSSRALFFSASISAFAASTIRVFS